MTEVDLDAIGSLSAVEQRLLGSLLEKQSTVPASYPLSLNALRSACNQTSSRDPVSEYDESELQACVKALKDRDLVRFVWAGKGSRAIKYHQLLDEAIDLDEAERALLTVLLLRGAQAPGELKTRTERLHSFADRDAVEAQLRALAERGLVRELAKVGGQHDRRWIHLLGPVESATPAASSGAESVDREIVLLAGADDRDNRVRAAWDSGAEYYAEHTAEDLFRRPLERMLLDEIVELVGEAPVLDVGCGPGHVAGYLAEAGAQVTGIDLSPAMIEQSQARYPEVTFSVGNQSNLLRPPAAHSWGAIVSFYSTIHLAGSELGPLFAEFGRVLDDDGRLLLAMRIGAEVSERTDAFGAPIEPVYLVFHDQVAILEAIEKAGFVDVQWYKRGPIDDETDPELFFVTARRP